MKDEKFHDLKIMSGTINLEMIVPSVSAFRSSIIGPKYVYKKNRHTHTLRARTHTHTLRARAHTRVTIKTVNSFFVIMILIQYGNQVKDHQMVSANYFESFIEKPVQE